MNRRERRAAASRGAAPPRPHPHGFGETVKDRLARVRSEDRYVAFKADEAKSAQLYEIESRIMASLKDVSCWEAMIVMHSILGMCAAFGVHTDVDELGALTCENHLKNCREYYLRFAKLRDEKTTS